MSSPGLTEGKFEQAVSLSINGIIRLDDVKQMSLL
jgi:hypothetical protein